MEEEDEDDANCRRQPPNAHHRWNSKSAFVFIAVILCWCCCNDSVASAPAAAAVPDERRLRHDGPNKIYAKRSAKDGSDSPPPAPVCSCSKGTVESPSGWKDVTLNVRHNVLVTKEGLTTGVVYSVEVNATRRLRSVQLVSEDDLGAVLGSFQAARREDFCRNLVKVPKDILSGQGLLLNWTLPVGSVPRNDIVVFGLCYQVGGNNRSVYEKRFKFNVLKGCDYRVDLNKGSLSSSDLDDRGESGTTNCTVKFSNVPSVGANAKNLLVTLTRLNVPCNAGYVKFHSFLDSPKLCGKLEEIRREQREYHFTTMEASSRAPAARVGELLVVGRPVFAVTFKLVDHCHNVTLRDRNGSLVIKPLLKLFCNFKITLPYGYRVALRISVAASSDAEPFRSPFKSTYDPTAGSYVFTDSYVKAGSRKPITEASKPKKVKGNAVAAAAVVTDKDGYNGTLKALPFDAKDPLCSEVLFRIWDDRSSAYHCGTEGVFSLESRENAVAMRISTIGDDVKTVFKARYEAVPIPEIVGSCSYGLVAMNKFCVDVVDEVKMGWWQSETECVLRGGHLTSISDGSSQTIVDTLLLKSPGYQDDNAYWVGACDIGHEGEFKWTDSSPFTYTNWFSGWPVHGYYNKQPNDDGFSNQDCVELRRQYLTHVVVGNTNATRIKLTQSFTWNDRDCQTKNHFLCSYPANANKDRKTIVEGRECNQKIALTEENSGAVITSPSFPHAYPDNKNCYVHLTAPASFNIVLVFEEFVLEEEPNCGYDYFEILENVDSNRTVSHKYCGDWSDKLKLLRFHSSTPKLHLRFFSDYSYNYSGFKARVVIEKVKTDCSDSRLQAFNNSCYLFVSYPQVTWDTARDVCKTNQGNLASVHALEEEHFIQAKIRESHEYTANTVYWLGGKLDADRKNWSWVDKSDVKFTAWLDTNAISAPSAQPETCLGIQWIPSPSSSLPSGLYWMSVSCSKIGGYVCKMNKPTFRKELNLNKTAKGTEGELHTDNFPGNYYHNLDYWMEITGPEASRIIVQFRTFDLEEQRDCLYDFLELYSGPGDENPARKCGHYAENQLYRLNFVSLSNVALLHFHSDYSVSGSGFSLGWKAVDVSGCPGQTLTARQGSITSPNYPNFQLANLKCLTTILAPVNRRVWLEITDWDLGKSETTDFISSTDLVLHLGEDKIVPFQEKNSISDGLYLSFDEYIKIQLTTGDAPDGRGFRAHYQTESATSLQKERVVKLKNDTTGNVYHLNYPLKPIGGIYYTQRFVAPYGYAIHAQFYHVFPSLLDREQGVTVCPNGKREFIQVRDHYADQNGTWWQFCRVTDPEQSHISITSYLNTLSITQVSNESANGVSLNASLTVVPDPKFVTKISEFPRDYNLESCLPDPCENEGKCLSVGSKKQCQCPGYFTGLFCLLTICEENPCMFGECELTADNFTCNCRPGYEGLICDKRVKPCSTNPCEGRGECVEKNNISFACLCHAWWEGERCERKLSNIPYRSLPERMLTEPFWLGLFTVLSLIACILIYLFAKKPVAEKLEKLLAENIEGDGKHQESSCGGRRGAGHSTDAHGPNGSAGGCGGVAIHSQNTTANSSPNSKNIFGRLGIRKPSMFSLSSGPMQHPVHNIRTFSLDDIFKNNNHPHSLRSYKHKHGGGGARKKSCVEKGSFLLQRSLDETDGKMAPDKEVELKESQSLEKIPLGKIKETSFTFQKCDPKCDLSNNGGGGKLEKKVTFAKLLSKVQNDMGGGEVASVATLATARLQKASGCSPQIASGSASLQYGELSTSETALAAASGDKSGTRRPTLLTLGPAGSKNQKSVSADSILAMFRKLSNNNAGESNQISACTSAASSPPEEAPFQEEDGISLASFHNTPLSTSSSGTVVDSPPEKKHASVIQVPVLDATQRATATNAPSILLEVPSKCVLLSPIREVPTPAPSPMITPILHRHYLCADSSKDSSGSDISKEMEGQTFSVPMITVSEASTSSSSSSGTEATAAIPTFTIDEPSPTNPPSTCTGMATPVITITCMTGAESDSDSRCKNVITTGMSFLSPFSCAQTEHGASESNLSSSGYSSLASPGPSRCGSSNPLCFPDESCPGRKCRAQSIGGVPTRSDSETMSDEGFATDVAPDPPQPQPEIQPETVADDGGVGGGSDSPLSDEETSAVGMDRFSPMFYGKVTDSDGLYDWTSSDCLKLPTRRRRRRSKSPRIVKSPRPVSPGAQQRLEPPKTPDRRFVRKPSPRRRPKRHVPSSSPTSSTESIPSTNQDVKMDLFFRMRMQQVCNDSCKNTSDSVEISGDENETTEDIATLCSISNDEACTPPEHTDTINSKSDHTEFKENNNFALKDKLRAVISKNGKDGYGIPLLHSKSMDVGENNKDEDNQDGAAEYKRAKRGSRSENYTD